MLSTLHRATTRLILPAALWGMPAIATSQGFYTNRGEVGISASATYQHADATTVAGGRVGLSAGGAVDIGVSVAGRSHGSDKIIGCDIAMYLRPARPPREISNRSDAAIIASYASDDNSSVILLGLRGLLSGALTGPVDIVGSALLGVDFAKSPLVSGSRHNPLRNYIRVAVTGGAGVRLAEGARFLGQAGFVISGGVAAATASLELVHTVGI